MKFCELEYRRAAGRGNLCAYSGAARAACRSRLSSADGADVGGRQRPAAQTTTTTPATPTTEFVAGMRRARGGRWAIGGARTARMKCMNFPRACMRVCPMLLAPAPRSNFGRRRRQPLRARIHSEHTRPFRQTNRQTSSWQQRRRQLALLAAGHDDELTRLCQPVLSGLARYGAEPSGDTLDVVALLCVEFRQTDPSRGSLFVFPSVLLLFLLGADRTRAQIDRSRAQSSPAEQRLRHNTTRSSAPLL